MALSQPGTRDTIQAGLYEPGNKYAVVYKADEGILVLPLAEDQEDGTPVEIVRVHQPVRRRVVMFDAAKQRTPPLIPAPESNDDEQLLSSEMIFPLPAVNPDNSTLTWSATGRIEFVERGHWSVASGYRIGDYPTYYSPLIIDPAQSPGDSPEEKADAFPDFNSNEYANIDYNYNGHFPSRYLVSEMSRGT